MLLNSGAWPDPEAEKYFLKNRPVEVNSGSSAPKLADMFLQLMYTVYPNLNRTGKV